MIWSEKRAEAHTRARHASNSIRPKFSGCRLCCRSCITVTRRHQAPTGEVKPGEKRPAIIFVHGGPVRQMLLGYHYMHFYHIAYAVNQWLASRGYVVMSINYRSGIGYGKSFRTAPNTGARGNAE